MAPPDLPLANRRGHVDLTWVDLARLNDVAAKAALTAENDFGWH